MKTLKAKYLNPKLNDVSSHPVISRKAHREKLQIPTLLIKSIQFVLESVLQKAEKKRMQNALLIFLMFSPGSGPAKWGHCGGFLRWGKAGLPLRPGHNQTASMIANILERQKKRKNRNIPHILSLRSSRRKLFGSWHILSLGKPSSANSAVF